METILEKNKDQIMMCLHGSVCDEYGKNYSEVYKTEWNNAKQEFVTFINLLKYEGIDLSAKELAISLTQACSGFILFENLDFNKLIRLCNIINRVNQAKLTWKEKYTICNKIHNLIFKKGYEEYQGIYKFIEFFQPHPGEYEMSMHLRRDGSFVGCSSGVYECMKLHKKEDYDKYHSILKYLEDANIIYGNIIYDDIDDYEYDYGYYEIDLDNLKKERTENFQHMIKKVK